MNFSASVAMEEKKEITHKKITKGLDPNDRPKWLQIEIDATFKNLSEQKKGGWNFNGNSSYSFFGYSNGLVASDFLYAMIKAYPKKKDFLVLDIGAGEGNFGHALFKKINNDKTLPDDLSVIIVSISGEDYGDTVEEGDRATHRMIGGFKIENLTESFKKIGIDPVGTFDLIVSDYCFMHLHDPVGTFKEAYDLLDKNGFMMMQGFPVPGVGLKDLLLETKAPFLIQGDDNNWRHQPSFLLRKTDGKLLNLPLAYTEDYEIIDIANTAPHPVPVYKNLSSDVYETVHLKRDKVYGDKNLYLWLIEHYPYWQTIKTEYAPLLKDSKDEPITTLPPPLFWACYEDNAKELDKLLSEGADVNAKDALGQPLLHKAIPKPEMLKVIEAYNPNWDIRNASGKTVLEAAIERFSWGMSPESIEKYLNEIRELIQKGCGVNVQNSEGNTPLHLALTLKYKKPEYKNKIIKLLLAEGANPKIKNNKGQTASDLVGKDNEELADLILKHE